jgi:hypothetical protein
VHAGFMWPTTLHIVGRDADALTLLRELRMVPSVCCGCLPGHVMVAEIVLRFSILRMVPSVLCGCLPLGTLRVISGGAC